MSWKMASIQNYLIQKQKYFASQNGMLLYTHIVSKKMMQVCHLIWICISILQIRNTLPAQNPLFYRKICFKKELNLNTLLYKKKVCQLEIMHDLLLSLLTEGVICLSELLLLPYPSSKPALLMLDTLKRRFMYIESYSPALDISFEWVVIWRFTQVGWIWLLLCLLLSLLYLWLLLDGNLKWNTKSLLWFGPTIDFL